MKAFAGNKINVTQNLKFLLERIENIVGKGENACCQHFFPFPTMFSKGFFLKVVKNLDCVVKIIRTFLTQFLHFFPISLVNSLLSKDGKSGLTQGEAITDGKYYVLVAFLIAFVACINQGHIKTSIHHGILNPYCHMHCQDYSVLVK